MTDELVLHGDKFHISPYVFSACVALDEKKLEYTYNALSLGDFDQKRESFTAAITGRVPALQHGNFWLAESSAIVEYLEDAFPESPRVLPSGVKERARARQVMAWIRSDLMAIREERATHTIFYEHTQTPLSKAGEAAAERLRKVAETLVPNDGFMFGAFSIADADLALMMQRLAINGDVLPKKAHAFIARVWARESVKKFLDVKRPAYVAY